MTVPLGEYVEKQWRDGTLTRVNEDGSLFEGDPFADPADGGAAPAENTGHDEPGAAGPSRPAAAAPKTEWVAYAVALGVVDDEAAAKAMTKAELVAETTPPELQAGA